MCEFCNSDDPVTHVSALIRKDNTYVPLLTIPVLKGETKAEAYVRLAKLVKGILERREEEGNATT